MDATLYERLGGAPGISHIVDDFVATHLTNPLIKARFVNTNLDHAKRMAREFFSAGSGGPDAYTGRDMRTAHRGMNINEQEYLAAMDDIIAAMAKNQVDEATRNEVIAILYSFKGDILRV